MSETPNYFSAQELTCQCGCNTVEFDLGFLAKLNAIRHEAGFGFTVSSAYRCPNHPIEARKVNGPGAHSTGQAVDIACSGAKALEVIRIAQKHGISRIGIQQKGSGRFIHLDDCSAEQGFSTPAIWSY
jgi:zinc D-Ala-D-Ala carboxypeptidase